MSRLKVSIPTDNEYIDRDFVRVVEDGDDVVEIYTAEEAMQVIDKLIEAFDLSLEVNDD